jgi:hypothetical protein
MADERGGYYHDARQMQVKKTLFMVKFFDHDFVIVLPRSVAVSSNMWGCIPIKAPATGRTLLEIEMPAIEKKRKISPISGTP